MVKYPLTKRVQLTLHVGICDSCANRTSDLSAGIRIDCARADELPDDIVQPNNIAHQCPLWEPLSLGFCVEHSQWFYKEDIDCPVCQEERFYE